MAQSVQSTTLIFRMPVPKIGMNQNASFNPPLGFVFKELVLLPKSTIITPSSGGGPAAEQECLVVVERLLGVDVPDQQPN